MDSFLWAACVPLCVHKRELTMNMITCNFCKIPFHEDCVNGYNQELKTTTRNAAKLTVESWVCKECSSMPRRLTQVYNDISSLTVLVTKLQNSIDSLKTELISKSDENLAANEQMNHMLENQLTAVEKNLLQDIHRDIAVVKNSIADEDQDSSDDDEPEPEGALLISDSICRDVVSTCDNLAVYYESGAHFTTLRKYLRKNKRKYKDLYIVCGTNNCNSKKPMNKIKEEYDKLCEEAKRHASKIHVSSVPPRMTDSTDTEMSDTEMRIDELNRLLAASADEVNIEFVDNDTNFRYQNKKCDERLLGSDGIHLSATGIQRLIENLGLKGKAICKFGSGATNRWSNKDRKPRSTSSGKVNAESLQQNQRTPHASSTKGEPAASISDNHDANERPIYFRGHKNPLSNFFPCNLHVYGENMKSSEHAFQLRKAILMKDTTAARQIRTAPTAKHAKDIGDKIAGNQTWHNKKKDVMMHILREKLCQCPMYRQALTDSGHSQLIEDTSDNYWARGPQGNGQNTLGEIHENLRQELCEVGYEDVQYHQLYDDENVKTRNVKNQFGNCWNCGESNHARRNCRFSYPVECYNCNRSGHKMKFCSKNRY